MTTGELIEMLKVHPADMRVLIEDADTNWYGDHIHVNVEGNSVILSIEYGEISSKTKP